MVDKRDQDGWTDGGGPPQGALEVVRLLETLRPVPTGAELDRARSRAITRVARTNKARRSLRARVAILGLTVVGLMVTITGTGMAISGISGSGSAETAQYGGPPQGQVLGGHRAPPTSGVRVTRQLAAAGRGDALPFTGLARFPAVGASPVVVAKEGCQGPGALG